MLISLTILTDQEIVIRKIIKASIKDILREAVVANPQVLTPSMEDGGGTLKYLNLDPLVIPKIRWVRIFMGEEDHLTGIIVCTNTAMY